MSLSRETMISRIEPFKERFDRYFKVGHIKFNSESEQNELAFLMKQINPRFNVNFKTGCGSCVRDLIVALSNYYDREVKYINEIVADNESNESNDNNDSYYEGLDKRCKEYRDWKNSKK